jgi:hypothetical protein
MAANFRQALWVGLWALGGGMAHAAGIAGVCPDGSAFIVQSRKDVPCPRAKLVPPDELPPLRPELLPHPYTWHVDQEARDPHNPYNLIDAAQKIRTLRAGEAPGEPSTPRVETATRVPAPSAAPRVFLSDPELRDLARIIELRQQIAPARLSVEDLQGRQQLEIELAHSPALEAQILEVLGESPEERRVLVFSARSAVSSEFHPNFLVVQDSLTFRPDPGRPEESGFLSGEPGPLPRGVPTLGYLVIPDRFDPAQPMDLWWNDRSLTAVLSPS